MDFEVLVLASFTPVLVAQNALNGMGAIGWLNVDGLVLRIAVERFQGMDLGQVDVLPMSTPCPSESRGQG